MRSGFCHCTEKQHLPRLVVVTGGPGAGKTAMLETVRRHFCEHVVVLPEAASVIFGGGFPRHTSEAGLRAAQRAIFHVQRQMERLTVEERHAAVVLCDRGTLDGMAYWPGPGREFLGECSTTLEAELARYSTVIHLRTPPASHGYNHHNPLRIESAQEAAAIDARIAEVWSAHPHRFVVESHDDFLDKVGQAIRLVRAEVPPCCRTNGDR